MAKVKPITESELRAAKLSRVPGVRIAEAAARFSVAAARVSAARKHCPELTTAELALAALTRNGQDSKFSIGELDHVARWLDYVNHDSSTARDVRRLLEDLAEQGWLKLGNESGELLRPWP